MLNIKFEPRSYLNLERKPKPKKQIKYVVAFNQRSGSTMFCDLLLQSGVMGQPTEYLKPEFIRKHNKLSLIDEDPIEGKLTKYLDIVYKHYHLGNGCNGLKLSWDQVLRIHNFQNSKSFFKKDISQILRNNFGDSKFILLTRANLIEQGISAFLSNQTGVWHSWDKNDNVEKPNFDLQSILNHTKQFADYNYQWKKALLNAEIDFIEIFYEEIVLDKLNAIKKTCEFVLSQSIHFLNDPHSSIKRVNTTAKNNFMNIILAKLQESP